MMSTADRTKARRIFEEAIAATLATYGPPAEEGLLEAQARDEAGGLVVVARYKLYTDGRVECFQILDEVLWPDG
jgi:hypothetical protein